MKRVFAFAMGLSFFCSAGFATPVYLFGGGDRPDEAMKDFVRDAGSQILIITWPTNSKKETFEGLRQQLKQVAQGQDLVIRHATVPSDEETKRDFLSELKSATGVFISGGSQGIALDLMQDFDLFDDFTKAFKSGVAFGGTSAGSAMMPLYAMTGEADLSKIQKSNTRLRRGLGLVPFLVDQHFLKRQRHNRLMSALMDHPEMQALGVDEDNAVRYEDHQLLAYGGSLATLFTFDSARSKFCIELIQGGDVASIAAP